jgi:hypothetical protein
MTKRSTRRSASSVAWSPCIRRRLVALRTLEFLTFWTYLANRGVWEALVSAGPTCTVPATDEDIGRYLDVYESLVAELTAA